MKKIIINYCQLVLLLSVIFHTASAAIIDQIEFVGNEQTKDRLLQREMLSKVGDKLDIKTVDGDIQAIMNLGLFKSVDYYLYAADVPKPDHVKLVIYVREKYYLFILPEIRYDEEDREFRLGVNAYWDNINGVNHSLRFKLREHGDTLGVTDVKKSLTYSMPRINGSPYRLKLFYKNREAVVEFENADPQQRAEFKAGFELFRWYKLNNRSRGWYSGIALYKEQRENQAFYDGGTSLGNYQGDFWGFRFGFKDVNEYLFNRRGKDFGYSVDTTKYLSDHGDEEYTKHLLFYRSYYRLHHYPLNNLNVQVKLGVSDGNYLGDTEFSLGGSSLRGYEKGIYAGNAMLQMNIEYLIPIGENPAYRYGVILDAGNTYDSFEDIDLARLHPAIGIGFRWKLADFVKVNLRLDIGYAIDTGTTNILLNSRNLF